MVYINIVLIVITLAVLILYCLECRKYKKLTSGDSYDDLKLLENDQRSTFSGSIKAHKLSDLAFKVDMVVRSGKASFWDYDVKNNMFIYSKIDSTILNKFSWADYLTFVHPNDRNIPNVAMQSLLDSEYDMLEASYRLKLPGSEDYRWFNVVGVVYSRDENGKPLLISGGIWDITSSVYEKQELEDSKALLELSFTASGLTPWEMDLSTDIIISNNENSVFFTKNYTIKEYTEIFIHPDHRNTFLQAYQKIENKETNLIDVTILTLSNDKYEWTHIIGKKVEDHRHGLFKAVGTSSFITEAIEKQEELIRLRNKADKSNTLKSAFLANMSHEIRTPLNAIVGFSNLIMESANDDQTREYGRIIEDNNNLLSQLVSDILDISKIEADQMEFHLGEVDICSIFADIHTTYSYKMPPGVEFICEVPDISYMIYTERNRFVQVISNILNNAIKYTSQGNITIGYTHISGELRFYVRDTGKGIPEEHIPKLFDRFSKFDPSVQGTGLGLSICQTIVERLGGRIGAISELDKGSEFWFTIKDIKE